MTKYQTFFFIGIASLAGCAERGSSDVPAGGSTKQTGVAAYFSWQVHLDLTASDYAAIDSDTKTNYKSDGAVFDDATHSILFPVEPLKGKMIQMGKVLAVTDGTGLMKASSAGGVTNGSLKSNLSDTNAIPFNVSQLGSLDRPSKIVFARHLSGEDYLNNLQAVSSMDKACCTLPTRGSYGPDCGHKPLNNCCLDYDNPSSPAPGKPIGFGLKLKHFHGSTCYKWLAENVCTQMSLSGLGTDEGKCLQNHKGRWCQDIDDSKTSQSADSYSISIKDTATIHLTNQSRLNEVKVAIPSSDMGSLDCSQSAGGVSSGTQVNSAFYTGPTTWSGTCDIKFTAPSSLPKGVSKITVPVTISWYNGAQTLNIVVCDCKKP